MSYRSTTLAGILTLFAFIGLTSCDVLKTDEDPVNQFNLHINTTTPTVKSGGNSIVINRIKMLVDSFRTFTFSIRRERREDTVVTVIDTMAYAEFSKKFPRVVNLMPEPGQEGTKIKFSRIGLGTYRSAKFAFHPPSGQVQDPDLGTTYSMIIEGTYNGNAFTYRSEQDTAIVKRISPELDMTEQTAVLDLDLLINTEALFKSKAGLVDPTTSAGKAKISKRLFEAIRVSEGDRSLREYQDIQPR